MKVFICFLVIFLQFCWSFEKQTMYQWTYNVYDQIGTSTLETTEKPKKNYRPTFSALMSAAVPGLGQAYNKKYWKPPVVLAIMAIPLSFTIYYGVLQTKAIQHYWFLKQESFNLQLQNLQDQILINPGPQNELALETFLKTRPIPPKNTKIKSHYGNFPADQYNLEQIQYTGQRYRADFEQALIFSILAYLLNVIDAFADGYFYKYDVSEKLHVRLESTTFSGDEFYTQYMPNTTIPGLKLSFNLK